MNHFISLLGYASGIGGAQAGSQEGPSVIQHSSFLAKLAEQQGVDVQWSGMIETPSFTYSDKLSKVRTQCLQLAGKVASLVEQKKFFAVIGGDHTSAIGTWNGVHQQIKKQGALGLIWVDAHMDSHIQDTSITGNLHGMPLACLLGHGEYSLTHLLGTSPVLHPENVCLIGARSYEEAEAALLKKLNVRVFGMEEIKKRGLSAVFSEALHLVTQHTVNYGISIDVDSLDPSDAPGTGVPEPDGLSAEELCFVLKGLPIDSRLSGIEIVEFDPHYDHEQKTEKWIVSLIAGLLR